ncbi:MAG: SUF system NifU family Fe-S cluster assembly protein [Proteobacteria bacterium]|nr:SUF system NifU family Fe-S cluster assembly protein [Pseudomonadota bacterium]MDE3208312.1 SUF system NifU family Fe-S cluster assembly protein [Pseudomonadota bacterium]
MNELRDLYQQVILDHYKQPRNFYRLKPATHHAKGHNPLCGDEVDIWLDIQDNIIRDIGFTGQGCAISTASASLMTEALRGKTLSEAHQIFDEVRAMVTTDTQLTSPAGKLMVLAGVRQFPARVKCAMLAWHTLNAALNHQTKPVSTEQT